MFQSFIFIATIFMAAQLASSKIIIIGAGASGIAAATRLLEKGINPSEILILEAENRIGGRIKTVPYGPSLIEMGAQWVHGKVGNVVFQLGSAAGEIHVDMPALQSTGYADNVETVYRDGRKISPDQLEEFKTVFESIEDDSELELVQWKGSLGEYFTKKFSEHLEQGTFTVLDRATALDLLDWAHRSQNIEDGSDSWMETSGSGSLEFEDCPGGDQIWKHGYSVLFDILMKKLPKKPNVLELPLSNRIRLNSPVRQIRWDQVPNNKIQVLSNNQTYEADIVLVTCSLGVLKEKANSLFIPILPEDKKRAIEGLGFGTVDKIFLEFQTPWWSEDWSGINLLTDPSEAIGDWEDKLVGFFTVRDQPNLLISWITGAAARKFETLSDAEVLQKCSAVLREAVGKDFDYEEPIKLSRSLWNSNPNFRGSYSFRSTKSEKLDVWASDLAEPVVDSNGRVRLLFAGEATHDSHYSTVHAAVETGWREADRIVELLQNSRSSKL